MKPVEWINKAVRITHGFSRLDTGDHYVYIILLAKVRGENPGYALYVGETSKKPEERFEQHKSGYKASKWVKNYGVQLLPNLYSHLIPLQREEAKRLEHEIAEALKKEEIPVYGGH